jgi:hypothetical protein
MLPNLAGAAVDAAAIDVGFGAVQPLVFARVSGAT